MKRLIKRTKRGGFALIAVLTILSLLAMLAIGMLSLSSIESRRASSATDRERAKANARFAAMEALSELQRLAGADTRITAPGTFYGASHHLTGVWRSWEGTDHLDTGQPIEPNYGSKTKNGDPNRLPDESSSSDGRFLGWLVSQDDNDDAETPPDLSDGQGKVQLVGSGSAQRSTEPGAPDPFVYVEATELRENNQIKGAYGWWISGENQKAFIGARKSEIDSTQEAIITQKANAYADHDFLSVKNVDHNNAPRIISRETLDLISEGNASSSNSPTRQHFHDLSANARGLLTNAATGGWKRDLSLFAENFNQLDSEGLPLFTIKPGLTSRASKSKRNSGAQSELIFPWAERSYGVGGHSGRGYASHGPSVSWDALVDYALQYRDVSWVNRVPRMNTYASAHVSMAQFQNRRDSTFRHPVIARVQSILSYYAIDTGQVDSNNQSLYQPCIVLNPVVTIWNPFNVSLSITDFTISMGEITPVRFQFRIGRHTIGPQGFNDFTALRNQGNTFTDLEIKGTYNMGPGQTLTFSPASNSPQMSATRGSNSGTRNLVAMQLGYNDLGGIYFPINRSSGRAIRVPANTNIEVLSLDLQAGVGGWQNPDNVGVQLDYSSRPDNSAGQIGIGAHRMMFPQTSSFRAFYDSFSSNGGLRGISIDLAKDRPRPFLGSTFSHRTNERNSQFTLRGMLQGNPLTNYTELGVKAKELWNTTYDGANHPINSPYELRLDPYFGDNDPTPDFDRTNFAGYIISGRTSGDGLHNCVLVELPTRPLVSLLELNSFDHRKDNPIPPFTINTFGNSTAQPLFRPDEIHLDPDGNNTPFQYDDSYVMNHLFMDDWFVSSIAREPRAFSRRTDRSIEEVYEGHVKGVERLPVANYVPSPLATRDRSDQDIKDDAFLTIASKLEVEGMFNVNSTSLTAWKALLRNNRGSGMAFVSGSNNNASLSIDNTEQDAPFSRFSIAGEGEAGTPSKTSDFSKATEYGGYRVFTNRQLDELARLIVEEIKARGPFLSLSEFMNRRLSQSDLNSNSSSIEDPRLAGAVQAALNELAQQNGTLNPFKELIAHSTRVTADPTAGYKFPEAAAGFSAEGAPGWTLQADVLRPLAPVLAVRDDTFVIRAYGDVRSSSGVIQAQAWCEVVVQRSPEFVDRTDAATAGVATKGNDSVLLQNELNARLGRRFNVLSVRYLDANEV